MARYLSWEMKRCPNYQYELRGTDHEELIGSKSTKLNEYWSTGTLHYMDSSDQLLEKIIVAQLFSKIPLLTQNPEVHYHTKKDPPMLHVLSHLNLHRISLKYDLILSIHHRKIS
jgi:hypothetical protein